MLKWLTSKASGKQQANVCATSSMKMTPQFRRHDQYEDVHFDRFGFHDLTLLLAGGIINPFGPTLTLLAARGRLDVGEEAKVFHVVLNPFRQVITEVGIARISASDWTPAVELEPFFALPFGGCPTLLLPNAGYSEEQAIELHAKFLSTFENGSAVLHGVREHPGDPWQRVQHEIDNCVPPRAPTRPQEALLAEEARELATYLLDPSNLMAEFYAFRDAWHGSVQFQAREGSPELAAEALQGPRFALIMALLMASCRMPGLGPDDDS